MKAIKTTIAALTLTLPSAVQAASLSQGNSYWGIGGSLFRYDPHIEDTADPFGITGRLGHFVADQIAIEGRIGFGLLDDPIQVPARFGAVDIHFDLDRLLGVYGVGHISLNDSALIYSLLGYTDAKSTALSGPIAISRSAGSISFGVGLEFSGMTVEYVRYLNEDYYTVSGITVSAKVYF